MKSRPAGGNQWRLSDSVEYEYKTVEDTQPPRVLRSIVKIIPLKVPTHFSSYPYI